MIFKIENVAFGWASFDPSSSESFSETWFWNFLRLYVLLSFRIRTGVSVWFFNFTFHFDSMPSSDKRFSCLWHISRLPTPDSSYAVRIVYRNIIRLLVVNAFYCRVILHLKHWTQLIYTITLAQLKDILKYFVYCKIIQYIEHMWRAYIYYHRKCFRNVGMKEISKMNIILNKKH